MTAFMIAVAIIYLMGIATTFDLAQALTKQGAHGRHSYAFRWIAAYVWPITLCVATAIEIARLIRARAAGPPRAVANERREAR